MKRGVDNSAPGTPLFGSCASGLEESASLFGASSLTQSSCRSGVIQMIAERSVNCSLISLPKLDKSLPFCGPLEGLALMYILREQGALVALQPELRRRFEAGLGAKCPVECYYQFFEPVIRPSPRRKGPLTFNGGQGLSADGSKELARLEIR